MDISLDKIKMNVFQTSENGIVNKDTIFAFTQTGNEVCAEYSGGQIKKGFLVGLLDNNRLDFSYCQLQLDSKLDFGRSSCEISIGENDKIRLVERFEWASRPGERGINIFEEI